MRAFWAVLLPLQNSVGVSAEEIVSDFLLRGAFSTLILSAERGWLGGTRSALVVQRFSLGWMKVLLPWVLRHV